MTINKRKYQIALAKSGLSSKEVAEAAHISIGWLNEIVNKNRIRPETAGKVARALGVDVTEIIDTKY